jgi:hypothetical protein
MSVENFLEPGNRKNLPERPNHRRTKAAQSSKSLFKRTICQSGPQAVLEDRFQECIGFSPRERGVALVAVAAVITLS